MRLLKSMFRLSRSTAIRHSSHLEQLPPTTMHGGNSGFNLVLYRTANIVLNISEHQATKFLQIHCGNNLLSFLGKLTSIEMACCSDNEEELTVAKSQVEYHSVEKVDFTKELPFRSGAYHAVSYLIPPGRSLDLPLVNIDEAARLVGDSGFLILGMSESLWERLNMMDVLGKIGNGDGRRIKLYTAQAIDCEKDNSGEADLNGNGEGSNRIFLEEPTNKKNFKSSPKVTNVQGDFPEGSVKEYYIAVLRKI